MKVRLYATCPNLVEVDAVVFSTPEAVDRFIRALELAKKTVWVLPTKKLDEKK